MQIGLILKNSCKGNKLTKYSKKTYKCMILWHRVPNIVWGEKKKFRRQRRKKKDIRFVVCHIKTLGKAPILPCVTESSRQSSDFAVCQQLGTRQKIILPCVFSSHSAKTQFAVCLIFAVSFFCLALGIYCACRVPVMLLTAKSQAHGKLRFSRIY